MRIVCLVFSLFLYVTALFSQEDQIGIKIGGDISFLNSMTNEWMIDEEEYIYVTNYEFENPHRITYNNYMSISLNSGFNVPIIKNDPISLGIELNGGIGFLKKRKTEYSVNSNENIEYQPELLDKQKKLFLYFNSNLYLRYNLTTKYSEYFCAVFGGIRGFSSVETTTVPNFGLRFGSVDWSVEIYGNLTKTQYFRTINQTELELAKEFNILGGVSINYILPFKH
jgi:hypothetical protein